MGEPVISISQLTYSYHGGSQALKDIDLEINEGEYVAILGANGAGKTTLCLLMNGVIPNVVGGFIAGQVRVLGRNPFETHVYEIAQDVGLVLQDPESQLFSSNVISEIAFAAENRAIPREEILKRLREVTSIVRLDGMENRLSDELSGGQKQRLAIAANLIVRPRILVADEPTSQLDPIGKSEVFATLQSLNQNHGMTVVIASHAVEEVVKYAHRVIVLDHGEIVRQGTPEQVFREIEALDRIFVHVPGIARLGHFLNKVVEEPPSLDSSEAVAQFKSWLEEEVPPALLEIPLQIKDHPESSVQLEDSHPDTVTLESKTAVNIENLTFYYPEMDEPALVDIDCRIAKGEFVAIIGQNGAGKTTLMKCLVGLLKPTIGEIELNGESISEKEVRDIASEIGLILQNPDTQLFHMSIEEEIQFGLVNLGLDEGEVADRVEEALRITGFEDRRELYPFKLSLGDRRKVAVASIVAMRPSILILDEPLTGQDYKGRYDLCNIAASLHRDGHTVIMITHDMELVAEYAARTIAMKGGSIILDAPTKAVFDQVDLLRSTYIEAPKIVSFAQALRNRGMPSGLLTVSEVARELVSLKKQMSRS